MSHAGPPPEPPGEPNQSDPSRSDPGAADPPGQPEADQPWSPYPTGWDQSGGPGPADPAPTYGQQPPTPAPYGQPAPYQPNPYGPPTPGNAYGGTARPDRPVFGFGGYASWFSRVGAWVIDYIASLAAGFPLWIGYAILLANTTTTTAPDGSTTSTYDGSVGLPLTLIVLGALTSLAFFVWNICIRQGRTGASIGKSVLAIRLVNADQQPIGAGWSFLRYLLHIVDALPCYLGYFWPIWDERKQTFADKIMSTYVIHATQQQPQPY
jgi:uncharacterized RDD family membrane protein YckC